jgi:ribonuclease R
VYQHRILDHLAHPQYEPARAASIARDMRIEGDERKLFDDSMERLIDTGRAELGDDDRLRLPRFSDEVVGRFRLNARGFGFVIPEHPMRDGDLFIPPGATRDAISGDTVRAEVVRRGRHGAGQQGVSGRIVEVVQRGQDQFVGVLIRKGGQWFVEPDGRLLSEPVLVRDPHAKNATDGDKVVIELLHYPEKNYAPEGVITKVLGEAGRPDVETQAVIEAHGLRTEFSDEVLDEARAAAGVFEAEAKKGWSTRMDLREEFIFTIDPPDARDFDDAISISHDQAQDEWTLGVHIADVAHFVNSGGVLDEEAKARGNSVYLPRLVIPMLPEVLSNGVCSLQEGVDRCTRSAFITFDGKGRVLNQRVAATVIRSRKRLTYLEAQAIIDGDLKEARRHGRTDTPYEDDLTTHLVLADRLAHILQERRRRDGMIVLHLPEVELLFDDDGHVVEAQPEDDAFTHTLIEMFMVEANEAVARLFSSLGPPPVPILRRIHPDPSLLDMEELRLFATVARQHLPADPSRHDLQQLLEAVIDTPAARAVHFAVLRVLTKAMYSPAMIGHFALASDHYAHFTSPIRRYPDLTLHRTLDALLDCTENGARIPGGRKRERLARTLHDDSRVLDERALVDLGRHCSDTEVEATSAERELRNFLVMQFLKENHLGDEFEGVVTGVTASGVFISIEQFLVEGMVRLNDVRGDDASARRAQRWRLDQQTGRLIAPRSGASLGLGDAVAVRIERVDLGSRHLDLEITRMPERHLHSAAASAPRKEKVKGKRKGYKQGRRGRRG